MLNMFTSYTLFFTLMQLYPKALAEIHRVLKHIPKRKTGRGPSAAASSIPTGGSDDCPTEKLQLQGKVVGCDVTMLESSTRANTVSDERATSYCPRNGRAVLLTTEKRLMGREVSSSRRWLRHSQHTVAMGGLEVEVFTVGKRYSVDMVARPSGHRQQKNE